MTRMTTPAGGPHQGLREVPRGQLVLLAALAAVKAVGLILLGQALATGITAVADGTVGSHPGTVLDLAGSLAPLCLLGALGVLLRAAATWGMTHAAQRTARGTKERLRHRLVAAELTGRTRPGGADAPNGPGAVAALATRGLDGLDEYYTTFLPALVGAAVVPVFIGARILAADWVSALILVLTVPLVPVFMALIGLHTQDRVAHAAAGLDALSNQLAELAQGLPALIGLRRSAHRRQGLTAVSRRYRESTMSTLRTAFLSGFALELIAMISVAVVAVFIGVRLVYGQLGLDVGLLALILAPEVFLPLRAVGAAFHASEDGLEALRRAEDLLGEDLEGPRPAAEDPEGADEEPGPVGLRVHDLVVRYAGAQAPALSREELTVAPGERTVLDGPSGSGKTTLLHALAGVLPADAEVAGVIEVPGAARTAWIGQHPRFTEPTATAELRLYAPDAAPTELTRVLQDVRAGHLATLPLERLSPGELRRIAVARALLRIRCAGACVLLADEPTAHLDEVSAAAVRSALAGLVDEVTLVVATHDRELAAMLRPTPAAGQLQAPREIRGDLPATQASVALPPGPATPETAEGATPAPASAWPARRGLLRSIRWWRSGMAGGILLATASVLSGAALTAVSGWLIVNASTQPPMMVLMVAIVGVRFFGLGRAVLRYAQQLAVHRAVLDWATTLRARLWDALSDRPAGWGKLTRSGDALRYLVADVDELRDAAPRVLVPLPAAILAWLGSLITAALVFPSTTVIFLGAGVLGFLLGPWLAVRIERGSAVEAARHRSWATGRISTLFTAAADLRANGVATRAATGFTRRDRQASTTLLRAAMGTGLGEAIAVLTSGLAALGCLLVAGAGGAAGADAAALLAVVALLALSLNEPFANASEAASKLPLFGDRLDAVGRILLPEDDDAPAPLPASASEGAVNDAGCDGGKARVESLQLDRVSVTWTGTTAVVEQISARVERGGWLAITGPSGSGKSSLLAVLLGLVRPSHGAFRLEDGSGRVLDPWREPEHAAPLLGRITWCPQEAHLFDSSLRNNLSLGRAAHDPATDAELHAALHRVGLGTWFAQQGQGLATRIGSGGHRLSGGQRQRLAVARALVARADAVLLDEPTAHLGQGEALELIADLREALSGMAVVMVTHDTAMAAGADTVLDLGGGAMVSPLRS